MIGRLEGRVHQLGPGEVLLDTGGVGFRVAISVRTYEQLANRETAALWIHTSVRSDQITLFGFTELAELDAFEQLIGVAGVGPRIALAVLSGMTPGELASAVDSERSELLCRVPGVGRKTAERIVLELHGALDGGQVAGGDRQDAVSALVNLGYSHREALRAVDAVLTEAETDLADVLRRALRALNA